MRPNWVGRLLLTDEQRAAAFCQSRSRQSDDEFASACLLPADPEARRVAIAVRRAIARIGKVDPEFIRADDLYPDQLGALPLWDSMDWLAYFMELEHELGLIITDKQAVAFFEPDISSGISVREMVGRVRAILTGSRPAR